MRPEAGGIWIVCSAIFRAVTIRFDGGSATHPPAGMPWWHPAPRGLELLFGLHERDEDWDEPDAPAESDAESALCYGLQSLFARAMLMFVSAAVIGPPQSESEYWCASLLEMPGQSP